jgi:hypothetical protein
MSSAAIFAQLQLGVKFDKNKWKKQIQLFESASGEQGAGDGGAKAHSHVVRLA